MRYHEAAVIDANHLIKIISALLYTTTVENEDESKVIEGYELLMISTGSDSMQHLSSIEREILEDSRASVTSFDLFQKVRLDAARATTRLPIL